MPPNFLEFGRTLQMNRLLFEMWVFLFPRIVSRLEWGKDHELPSTNGQFSIFCFWKNAIKIVEADFLIIHQKSLESWSIDIIKSTLVFYEGIPKLMLNLPVKIAIWGFLLYKIAKLYLADGAPLAILVKGVNSWLRSFTRDKDKNFVAW